MPPATTRIGLATRLGISSFVVGLTVVAFGTSAPELAASIQAAWRGEGALAVGNVVGSNIANVCLILGLTAVLRPVPCKSSVIAKDVPVMIGVTILGMIVMGTGPDGTGLVTRLEGGLLVAGIVLYTGIFFVVGRRESRDVLAELERQIDEYIESDKGVPKTLKACIILSVVGAITLAGGAAPVGSFSAKSISVLRPGRAVLAAAKRRAMRRNGLAEEQ